MNMGRTRSAFEVAAAAAGIAAVLLLGTFALRQKLPAPARPAASTAGGFMPCDIPGGGYWRGSIHGDGALTIDWGGPTLGCDGNLRPDGGVRLFFAGEPTDDGHRLILVIGIGASLDALAGRELAANVTLIDESRSRFFSSSDERCFARIAAVEKLQGYATAYRVAGELYCAGSLPAVAGPESVTLGDMQFAGRFDAGDL